MNYAIVPYLNNHQQTTQAIVDLQAQSLPTRILTIANGGARLINGEVLSWQYVPALPLAAVWNRALQFVWEAGGEYALVVNNDVRLPKRLYQDLLETLQKTGAWFVTATNQAGNSWYDGMMRQSANTDDPDFLASRGGPDFSCFLITKDCHQQYTFDEQFSPAYCEDVDMHRRMMLGGHGSKIFSVCVPYLHYGSGTLKSMTPAQQERLGQQIGNARQYYEQKWGGPPNQETYYVPFGSTLHPAQRTPPIPDGVGPTTPELQRWAASKI